MPEVHPTARIGPEAALADDAVVGPHCRIEGPVTLGPGACLLHRVTIRGPVHVGANTRIYPNASLAPPSADEAHGHHFDADPDSGSAQIASDTGGSPDDASGHRDRPALIVGAGVIIREGVRIAPGCAEHPTRIGDEVYLMINCRIAPHAAVGESSTIVNGVRIGSAAEVGPNALLGGNASIAAGCRVGRLATLSGAAELTRDLPPFCTAYYTDRVGSLNLVGLRRIAGRAHIRPLRRAFNLLYRRNDVPAPDHADHALDRIEAELADNPLCAEFVAFIHASRRGIAPYANAASSHDLPGTRGG